MHICKKGKMQAGPKVRFVVDNMSIKVSVGVLEGKKVVCMCCLFKRNYLFKTLPWAQMPRIDHTVSAYLAQHNYCKSPLTGWHSGTTNRFTELRMQVKISQSKELRSTHHHPVVHWNPLKRLCKLLCIDLLGRKTTLPP